MKTIKTGDFVTVNSNDFDPDFQNVNGIVTQASAGIDMYMVELEEPVMGLKKWAFTGDELEVNL